MCSEDNQKDKGFHVITVNYNCEFNHDVVYCCGQCVEKNISTIHSTYSDNL